MTNWDELNLLANSYIDILQDKVGAMGRLLKMEQLELKKAGLYIEIVKKVVNERTGKEATSRKLKPIDLPEIEKSVNLVTFTDGGKEQKTIPAEDMRKYIKGTEPNATDSDLFFEFRQKYHDAQLSSKAIRVPEPDELKRFEEAEEKVLASTRTHDAYIILEEHRDVLEEQRKTLLKRCKGLFESTPLWDWCVSVKGLSDVAGMTFAGFINPTSFEEVTNVWSYCGLAPDKKAKKRGEQGHSNPLIKGRMWMISTNVIKSTDPFYYRIYRIKKAYYKQRPDLLEQKGQMRGWDGKIEAMSKRILMKLLISHAFDLVTGKNSVSRHRNPIPIKPKDESNWQSIFDMYTQRHDGMLEKLNALWGEADELFQKKRKPVDAEYKKEVAMINKKGLDKVHLTQALAKAEKEYQERLQPLKEDSRQKYFEYLRHAEFVI